MASQLLKRCMNRRTQGMVDIRILTQAEGYRRILQSGWEAVKEEHIKRVEDEVEKLPTAARTVIISDIFHESREDPRSHLTLIVKDANGSHITTKHVTKDPALQDESPAPNDQTPDWIWDETYQKYRYWNGKEWIWQ